MKSTTRDKENNRSSDVGAPRAPLPKREWRIKKLLRLGAFCAVACLAGAAVAGRAAYGDAMESALLLGHELRKMPDVGSNNPVRLNGESIYMESAMEDMPLDEVLDAMEAACKAGSVVHVEEIDELAAKAKAAPSGEEPGAGVLRQEGENSGFVACFVREPGSQRRETLRELGARLVQVLETGDLGKLGGLRYVFAERAEGGRTHVVMAWTQESFNVYRVFPEGDGDAPGVDPRNVPRPPRSSRLLTADVVGAPYGVYLYTSGASPSEVLSVYDSELPKQGWDPIASDPEEGAAGRAFQRDGVDMMIFVEPDGDRSVVSFVEMRSLGPSGS